MSEPFRVVPAAASRVPAGAFWGKLGAEGWHPLIAHSADVAMALDVLLERGAIGRWVAAAAGLPQMTAELRARLVYLASLHDVGKTNVPFQLQGQPDAAGLPRRSQGHVQVLLNSLSPNAQGRLGELAALVRRLFGDSGFTNAFGPDEQSLDAALRTTICHHGRPWSSTFRPDLESLWLVQNGLDPLAEIRRIGETALQWSAVPARPMRLRWTPAFSHAYAGALTLADWVGSTAAAFRFRPEADADPVSYAREAREIATHACAQIGLIPTRTVVSVAGHSLLERVFPGIFPGRTPTPLQTELASSPLPAPGTRFLIESETGSGKTEAALALYARLRAAGLVDGLAFLLPTRATASAMLQRVEAATTQMYESPPSLALAAGGRAPFTQSIRGLPLGAEAGKDPEDAALRAWASGHAKRFLSAEIVVGTIDQALLSVLPVKHAHMRAAALSRHLIVVDEVHSYDRYTGTLLEGLLERHCASGGIALLMSATLSAAQRERFAAEPGAPRSATEEAGAPFPSLGICPPAAGWTLKGLPNPAATIKPIEWYVDEESGALTSAIEAARAGARVCVIRNTVAAARSTVERIAALGGNDLLWSPRAGGKPTPYHSRYSPTDRAALDEAVLRDFGRGSTRLGVILVATQVAEQSLDIDFDFMVSDLCPVDALLQRAGREHRHPERERPLGFDTARLCVIAPSNGLVGFTRSGRGPNGWGTVYEDLADLELTRQLIVRSPRVHIPTQNRWLIEEVYHPDRRADLAADTAWSAYMTSAEGRDMGQSTHARSSRLDWKKPYPETYAQFEAELKYRTRLGDDSVELPLAVPCPHMFAPGAAASVIVSLRELSDCELDLANPTPLPGVERADGHPAYKLGNKVLTYSTTGWVMK